jgi:hypothetical protein
VLSKLRCRKASYEQSVLLNFLHESSDQNQVDIAGQAIAQRLSSAWRIYDTAEAMPSVRRSLPQPLRGSEGFVRERHSEGTRSSGPSAL